ncbi:hypothetical protein LP420_20385 [Massilia sp. B-10]|nr:hypothetical protein LP420_20385 [Massilia sp. B-10]
MDTTLTTATNKPGLAARLKAHPLVRIVLGLVLTFAPVPLTMILASQLVAKPYRVVWPQLLAAVLVWFGYRYFVRRIEQRAPTELAMPGMARELGSQACWAVPRWSADLCGTGGAGRLSV